MPTITRAFTKEPRLLQQDCGVGVRYQRRWLLNKMMIIKNFRYSGKNMYWDSFV